MTSSPTVVEASEQQPSPSQPQQEQAQPSPQPRQQRRRRRTRKATGSGSQADNDGGDNNSGDSGDIDNDNDQPPLTAATVDSSSHETMLGGRNAFRHLRPRTSAADFEGKVLAVCVRRADPLRFDKVFVSYPVVRVHLVGTYNMPTYGGSWSWSWSWSWPGYSFTLRVPAISVSP